ncbi:hypothetical protein ACEWY4_026530 [Coilia grayii]|uniref:RNA polymerase II subunit M n=1 Tax=Coilia grayii TaxID=363190 RepID=A0ABD1IS22_9TELE
MSWTERQGLVGDLHTKSKEELCEILQRQEKLLSNKRFIHTLPDKGRKIAEFAGRVSQALSQVQDADRKSNDLSSVRTEFQAQYQHALTCRQPNTRTMEPGLGLPEKSTGEDGTSEPQHVEQSAQSGPTPLRTSEHHDGADVAQQHSPSALETMETAADGKPRDPLAEALARVSLAEQAGAVELSRRAEGTPGNPFLGRQPQRKPHSVDVVERTERGAAPKHKFKPNQLIPKSGSPSPAGSLGGAPPLSAEARRQRDRKHLDDITAANLTPLHHGPAQLLTLEEAHTLMRQQTHRQMELEARMAAQKLSESLSVSMGSYHPEGGSGSYHPEGGSGGAYREAREPLGPQTKTNP